jgi:hypothetical protein
VGIGAYERNESESGSVPVVLAVGSCRDRFGPTSRSTLGGVSSPAKDASVSRVLPLIRRGAPVFA